MRLNDSLKLSTRMFKTNPGRTWLTIMGMGVGTGAVVMLVGLGYGLQGILIEQIVFGDTLLSLNVTAPSSNVVVLDDAHVNGFLKIPDVEDVSPLASFPALVTMDKLTGNLTLQGVNPSYFRYAGVTAEKGTLFQKGNENSDRNKIILSDAALKLFQVSKPEDAIGKTVRLRITVTDASTSVSEEVPVDKDYQIIAITSDAASISATILLPEMESIAKVQHYDRVQVKVSDSKFLTAAQDAIIKEGFSVTALSKTVEQANQIFTGIQWVLAGFGGIALIVSAIGMFNTMTVTLLERTNEIGVMRTLGASPGDIKLLFLTESVIVGFLGGLAGIVMGVSGGLLINFLLNLAAAHFGGTAVRLFAFPLGFLSFIATFSGVVGFCTGIFPARRASNLNPLEAIRYK